jgi:mxaL protein
VSWPRPDLVALAGVALLAAAAAWDPQRDGLASRHEWVAVVDITQSMDVEDVQLRRADGLPAEAASRLAQVRTLLQHTVRRLPCGERLGIGIFSEYRSLLLMAPVEVCAQRAELVTLIGRLDGRMAWSGNSEVAKGLYGAIGIAQELPDRPSLLFFSDGHEAPPVNPRHRPAFGGERGAVKGVLIGVGGPTAVPIPRTDPFGRVFGFWGADDVLQTDPRSLGRGGSVAGETMVEPDAGSAAPAVMAGATPGREHLSALREGYLQLLASETGLGYRRLDDAAGLARLMLDPALARAAPARLSLAPWLAAAALAGLVLLYLRADLVRLRRRWRRRGTRVQRPTPAAMRPQR